MPLPLLYLDAASVPDSMAASRRLAEEAMAVSSAIACWSFTIQVWSLSQSPTRAFPSAHELMTSKGGDS